MEDVTRPVGGITTRLLSKFEQRGPDACWPWRRPRAIGYGYFYLNGREVPAHRVVYEHFVGPIPEGLELDHLCRNRACVNPSHLEPVTHAENVRRGLSAAQMRARHASRTHCKHGHEFTPENTYLHPRGYRSCRRCQKERDKAARAARARASKRPRKLKTHCPQGHPYTDENTYVYLKSNGATTRNCRTCQRDRDKSRRRTASGYQN